jgi:hypothetical protein
LTHVGEHRAHAFADKRMGDSTANPVAGAGHKGRFLRWVK